MKPGRRARIRKAGLSVLHNTDFFGTHSPEVLYGNLVYNKLSTNTF
jgi:hypothetical protein